MGSKVILTICAIGTAFTLSGATCNRGHVQSVDMTNRCVDFHRRQLYPQAIRDCNKAISLDPDNEQAYHALGMVYIATKEYEQAARALTKAIALNEKMALYHYQLGAVYEWAGSPTQAETSLKRAIELDDTLYKAHYRLGVVYQTMEDPQNALQKYTDAINRNPRFFEAYRDLGSLYLDYSFLAQAEQVLNEGIQALQGRGDELAVLYHRLGTVLAEKQEYEAAVKQFRQALEMKPDMEDAMFSLGWSYSYVNPENSKIWLDKFVKSAGPKTRPDYVEAAQARLNELESGTKYE